MWNLFPEMGYLYIRILTEQVKFRNSNDLTLNFNAFVLLACNYIEWGKQKHFKITAMNTFKNSIFGKLTVALLAISLVMPGCKKKDDDDPAPAPKKTYQLKVKDVLGVSGTVVFTKKSATEVIVEITLVGAPAGSHPAHIHAGATTDNGGIVVSLNPVDATGKSVTTLATMTYDQVTTMDGYVNVHESDSILTTIIAQGDIGGNELTGTKKNWTLTQVGTSGVAGSALLEQRKNGTSLLTISLTGTLASGLHPSHIHLGSVATVGGGPIKITLKDVEGATGKSYTTIRALDDNTPVTYANLLVYDGYLNVHESMANLGNILCQGDIGSNAN